MSTSPCVVSCAEQAATAAGCSVSNIQCLCTSGAYQIKAVACLELNCPAEITPASQIYDTDCAAYTGSAIGVGPTTASTTSAFAGAATASKAVSGSSGASGASTGGSSTTSSGGGSKVSVGLIAGAAGGGVAALFIIGILIFCLCRRNKNGRRPPPPLPAPFSYTPQAGAQMQPGAYAQPQMKIASDASLRPLVGAFATASSPSTHGPYTSSESGYATTIASTTPSPPPLMSVVAPPPVLHEPRPRAPIMLEPPPTSPTSTRASGAWAASPTTAMSTTYPAVRKRALVVLSADSPSGSSSATPAPAHHAAPAALEHRGEPAEEEMPPPMYEDAAAPQ